MSTEQNKALVKRATEDFSTAARGDGAVLHQYFHDDVVTHTAHHHHHSARGLEALKAEASELGKGAPDFRAEVDQLMAEGDLVMAHFTLRGTHQGRGKNRHVGEVEPTGKQVEASGIVFCRVKDGKITEYWRYDNTLDRMIEAGALSVQPAGARG